MQRNYGKSDDDHSQRQIYHLRKAVSANRARAMLEMKLCHDRIVERKKSLITK